MLFSKLKWTLYISTLVALGTILSKQFIVEHLIRIYVADQKFVVSLSTTPYRINKIRPTLESIFEQKLAPSKVFLAIPYVFARDNLEYVIPRWLQEDKRIEIIRTNDYGPATKLLGTLKNVDLKPGTIVITVDDDAIYPSNMTTHLVFAAKRNPTAALGLSGANINCTVDAGTRFAFHDLQNVSVLHGITGVAYRVRFFDDSIYEIVEAPRECVNADDYYLSYQLAKNNIQRKILANQFINKHMVRIEDIGLQQDALHKIDRPVIKNHLCLEYMQEIDPDVAF